MLGISKDDASCRSTGCRQHAGNILWKTDGTREGTRRVEDLFRGSAGSNPAYLTGFGSFIYFAAATDIGRELWRSDGIIGHAIVVSQQE